MRYTVEIEGPPKSWPAVYEALTKLLKDYGDINIVWPVETSGDTEANVSALAAMSWSTVDQVQKLRQETISDLPANVRSLECSHERCERHVSALHPETIRCLDCGATWHFHV